MSYVMRALGHGEGVISNSVASDCKERVYSKPGTSIKVALL